MLNSRGMLAVLFGLAWVFLGAWVYWLRTGLTEVAPGTLSTVGAIVWFAPLLVALGIALMTPRGPLRRLHEPPFTVSLSEAGMEWVREGTGQGSAGWQDIGGVAAGGSAYWKWTVVRDRNGAELVRFAGTMFRDLATRRRIQLAAAVTAFRPDRYELSKRHRGGYESALPRS